MRLLPSLRARIRREESGFTVIEVMVSALLVVVLSVGVLKALDAAEASSGNNKARGVAANLAQQDQERLRAYRAKELSNVRETRTRTVAGVPYTVVSKSDWVSDSSGSKSCTSASARADYMRINSTVTWPIMLGAKPVSTNSIVAAPNGSFGDEGSLGVQVLNRTGGGQAGVAVSVSGPKNLSDTTDSSGCVFFGYLPEGNYTVTFSKPGHVDANGVANVSRVVGVLNETTQIQTIDYDLAAGTTVTAQTRRGTGNAVQSTTINYLSLGHANLASPGWRLFGNGTAVSSIAATNLFPFTGAYSAYSGNCSGNNPAALVPVGTVAPTGTLALTPGANPAIVVREPAVRMMQDGGSLIWPANSTVKLTAVTCGGTTTLTTNSQGWARVGSSTEYGIPYGVYNICVSGGSPVRRRTLNNVTVNNGDGQAINMNTQAGGTTGACP